ncbi:MAG: 16S rRNA (cytosine(1402)-N(4))-methyltransferase RsmH [Bacteroidetes bacterium]|nr:16S rRNA (cytosine(1402)-N(4))-methyltransferase RsmH [Bacteroidota bacterium]
MTDYHIPVMLEQCLEGLGIVPHGLYVDATYGGGGHSSAILHLLGPSGRLLAFDRDADVIGQKAQDQRLILINHDYRWITNFLDYHTAVPVHGILADLGVSSHQFDTDARGFSFRRDAPLDMRMDIDLALTAADVLNAYTEGQLQRVFTLYGEIKNAKTLAQLIVDKRKMAPITTTGQLAAVVGHAMHRNDKEHKYLSQVFQALRIEVNHELESLSLFLEQAPMLLKPGGRLVVISYHSLEDRLVKNLMETGNLEGISHTDLYGNILRPLTPVLRKPLLPSAHEVANNPRSRSAKLRIAEKA